MAETAKKANKYAKKYNKQYDKKATLFLSKGYSQRALISHLGVSHETYHRWKTTVESFGLAVEEGKSLQEKFFIDAGLDMMTGKVKGNASCWKFFLMNLCNWSEKTDSKVEDKPININFTLAKPEEKD